MGCKLAWCLFVSELLMIGTMAALSADEYALGCLREDVAGSTSSVALSTVVPAAILPPSVDHTAAMPPVMSQSYQSSCVAWSVGYAVASYLDGQEHGWSLSDPAHQVSPAFVYNQTNGGHDGGAYVSHAYWLLQRRGGASMADMPFSPSDYLSWPVQSATQSALSRRAGDWVSISKSNVDAAKQELSNGYVLELTIEVDSAWDGLGGSTNYVWYPSRQSVRGSHSICIIGYDDAWSGGGHIGAFKVQNSWGTGWGAAGYAWVAYDAMATAGVVSVTRLSDRVSYSPTTSVRLSLSHPFRGRLRIAVGAGSTAAPVYSETFYEYGNTNQGWTYDNQPNIATVVDVTAGSAYVSSQTWWVRIFDGYADGNIGTVTELRLEQGGLVRQGVGLPAALADQGTSYVYIPDVPVPTFTPSATPTATASFTATVSPTATASFTPTATPTETASFTPTATSTALPLLYGTVRFQNRTDNSEAITLKLRSLGTGAISVHSLLTDSSGHFNLPMAEPGLYEAAVEALYYLRARAFDIVVGADGGQVDFGTLISYDANSDNVVNYMDYAVFSGAYGSTAGSPDYRLSCDSNRDGKIGWLELSGISYAYGRQGAPDIR